MNNFPLRFLYFGVYDPAYSRNRVLIKGLRRNGAEVLECRSDKHSLMAYLELFFKYWRFIGKFDVMVVGFPGQEAMFMARLLTRKPIIFDSFTSHYEGYILDRKYFSEKSFRAGYYRFLDKWSCRLANFVLLDTQSHIDFFVKEYKLPANKFGRIFVGTDDEIFYPQKNGKEKKTGFLVHFHGHFIPLQGTRYVIEAAAILKDTPGVNFQIIGRGQEYAKIKENAERLGLKNIVWIDNVEYEQLPNYINKADVCLGIFGDTPKTLTVIPNKIFETIALKKPVITADTSAIRELFGEKDLMLVKNADPEALARGIIELRDNINLRNNLAENGFKKMAESASIDAIGKDLIKLTEGLIKKI